MSMHVIIRNEQACNAYKPRHSLANFGPGLFECVELVPIKLLNGLLDLRLVFEHDLEIALEFCFPLFDAI